MKRCTIAALVLLAGCAGADKVPELNQYLLRSDITPQVATDKAGATIGLDNVEVAAYLNQPGLVLQTRAGIVRPARYHQWAEPLRESLRSFLASEISKSAGQPVRHRGHDGNTWKRGMLRLINVHIDELHGTNDGRARLVASWVVVDTESSAVLVEREFMESELLDGDGYDALVRAETLLLTRLAQRVAAEL